MQEAVTLPNNTVTVFHAVTADLSLPLPWPRPATPSHPYGETPIMIWGGASSCGQYALQVLRAWGYRNLFTTASAPHHAHLRELGARHTFDYRDANVVELIADAAAAYTAPTTTKSRTAGSAIPFILDCIGSQAGSLAVLSHIAQKGARVAVLLPVILRDATEEQAPQYTFDVQSSADWADGVETRGVRTHFYEDVSLGASFLLTGRF